MLLSPVTSAVNVRHLSIAFPQIISLVNIIYVTDGIAIRPDGRIGYPEPGAWTIGHR
ncbi:hypothetical protein BDV23DRAFT_144832 [Aspergillus alliaceus]|uniref:Uncharacterized protein n=1 Tax=Petromyces alliaceus TaxID=209559 RepID=A0A5N7CNM9_PETAA|nr:hypothetical protein BDV23DRAFT_144832 [Aspergillus alliaceus]